MLRRNINIQNYDFQYLCEKSMENEILCKILHIFSNYASKQRNRKKKTKVRSDIKTERFLIINRVNFPTIIIFFRPHNIRYCFQQHQHDPVCEKFSFLLRENTIFRGCTYVLSGSFTRKHVKILTRVSLNKTLVWAGNIPRISRTAEKENSVSGGIIFVFAFCPARMQFSSAEHIPEIILKIIRKFVSDQRLIYGLILFRGAFESWN